MHRSFAASQRHRRAAQASLEPVLDWLPRAPVEGPPHLHGHVQWLPGEDLRQCHQTSQGGPPVPGAMTPPLCFPGLQQHAEALNPGSFVLQLLPRSSGEGPPCCETHLRRPNVMQYSHSDPSPPSLHHDSAAGQLSPLALTGQRHAEVSARGLHGRRAGEWRPAAYRQHPCGPGGRLHAVVSCRSRCWPSHCLLAAAVAQPHQCGHCVQPCEAASRPCLFWLQRWRPDR
mmetsp:Transcript_110499/g.180261  ORF Transcript_110499/g.180261 Transcript_110499/m.180261 type:complete len:229 (-) Transcript_110499:168-854(-)